MRLFRRRRFEFEICTEPGAPLLHNIGKKYAFRVTGIAGNALYGTGTYTSDSSLANAAVHMGVLKPGQTGIVRVEIVVPPPGYVGTTANGCTSMTFGAYNGAFKVLK